jgi:acyl dehydratase
VSHKRGGVTRAALGMEDPSPRFEDFAVGDVLRTIRRTVAEADMLAFVQVTGLFEELWLDAGKAERTGIYKGRLVPGYMTLSFAEGLVVLGGWMRNAVGMLGVTDVKWTAPVVCGDTIRVELEVVEARPSRHAGRGVLVMRHRVLNQEEVVVLEYQSARLIRMRQGAGEERG